MASNSEKQRALYRSREEAKANGTLPQWYAAREAERLAAQPAPPVPYESPEAAAWRAAYSGPEVGPVGGSWPEDATGYSRFMVWRLPLHPPETPSPAPNQSLRNVADTCSPPPGTPPASEATNRLQ